MKLYIWANPYSINYGHSMLLAVASSVEEAKLLAATQAIAYAYTEYGKDRYCPMRIEELREPTRVVDLPCAEWHRWEE